MIERRKLSLKQHKSGHEDDDDDDDDDGHPSRDRRSVKVCRAWVRCGGCAKPDEAYTSVASSADSY